MAELVWDKTGNRFFETGVEKGVLFPYDIDAGEYETGVVWNGLTAVNESPSGAEATALWADDIKYLNLLSNEDFGATIEAYTYPDEFAECDGSLYLADIDGVKINQQKRKMFGFSYVSKLGNDTLGDEYGYIIHIVYGALASPSERSRSTVNDSPEAITFSWTISTTPVEITGYTKYKPTAHLEINSKTTDSTLLKTIEQTLWGTASSESKILLPADIIALAASSTSD